MDLYTITQRLVNETENSLLLKLDGSQGNEKEFSNVRSRIESNLGKINDNIQTLEIQASKVPAQRRRTEKQRIEQIKFTIQSINTSLRSAERRHTSNLERARDRENLLNKRYTANSEQTEVSIGIQAMEAKHHSKLQQSHNDIDNIIAQGQQVYDNLVQDSQMFKRAKTKMLNVANTLGMSNTVMRLIEKRTTQDKFLLYGLMFGSALIMYAFWRYFS